MTPPRADDNATIRIVIPFKLRHRNGRPRILPRRRPMAVNALNLDRQIPS